MDEREVIEVLKALGEPTRLRLMLLLAKANAPMPVGAIAQNLNVRQNTLSAHIAVLARCDLILGHREGRNILYAANPRKTHRLKDYLAKTLCKA